MLPASAYGASRSAPKGPQCPTEGTRVVTFAKTVDGGFLTGEGEEVRLSGILFPGGGGETVRAVASKDAANALEDSLKSRSVSIAPSAAPRDRYGRIVAQVFADGEWVEARLLKAGQVRAAPDGASGPCAKALLAAETEGRTASAGHWRDGLFRLRKSDEVRGNAGTFEIVEGTVVTATVNRGRGYINFGPDYKTDFTVTVAPDGMKIFRAAKFDVKKLAGKHVRVRGWLEFYNGPEMDVSTPAAIEVLE